MGKLCHVQSTKSYQAVKWCFVYQRYIKLTWKPQPIVNGKALPCTKHQDLVDSERALCISRIHWINLKLQPLVNGRTSSWTNKQELVGVNKRFVYHGFIASTWKPLPLVNGKTSLWTNDQEKACGERPLCVSKIH